MNEYVFGANILENLTTGMYKDSKIIYREYIQNACDQIDKAIHEGLLNKSDGRICIQLELESRTISISDNATGIPSKDFAKILGNIADSEKKIGIDKGFRGIGRLCGLAYCKELIFSSKARGENVISIMNCNAQKMKELIAKNVQGIKYTANEVLNEINNFKTIPDSNTDDHWFKVELLGIDTSNTELLDLQQIKDYLSFVAPVAYNNVFIFRNTIYKYIEEKKLKIDEYDIRINGEPIHKTYKTHFKTRKGEDDIFDIKFKDINDNDGRLIAWLWYGLSRFKGVIQSDCKMRGIRLRKDNIQIGNSDALQKLFKEDRGQNYFVGEVFAISNELIPNSQRDYFNENGMRNQFEKSLKKIFYDDLHKLYYDCSAINSAYDKIELAAKKENEYNEKLANGFFVDSAQKDSEKDALEKYKTTANKAVADIEKKKRQSNKDFSQLIKQIEKKRCIENIATKDVNISKNFSVDNECGDRKFNWRTDKLSEYTKKERKLISKIFSIIIESTDTIIAEAIIKKIEDELK